MENSLRKERQSQGIKLAKAKGVYRGRKLGATTTKESLIKKHQDVIDLIRLTTAIFQSVEYPK